MVCKHGTCQPFTNDFVGGRAPTDGRGHRSEAEFWCTNPQRCREPVARMPRPGKHHRDVTDQRSSDFLGGVGQEGLFHSAGRALVASLSAATHGPRHALFQAALGDREQNNFVVFHDDKRDLRSKRCTCRFLDQLHVNGTERGVRLHLHLVAGFDDVGVVLTLVEGRFDDGTVHAEGVGEGVMLDADHVEQDPHGAAFGRFGSTSFHRPCGGVPALTHHSEALARLNELCERPEVIVGFTPQAHAHVVAVQDTHALTRKRP